MVFKITCCLIIIFVSVDNCKGQTLTESESVIINPGNNHKLTCTFSGINVDDAYISWIRQAEGKGLEWISHISAPSGSGKYYSKTVEGRFTISRDNSKLQVYLHMTNLKAEDTAVYYCARRFLFWGDAFDYWGKGTQVTVASDTQPSLFALSQCGLFSDGLQTIGCLASPAHSVNLKWIGENNAGLTDIGQYSTSTLSSLKFSYITVSEDQWKRRNHIKCQADTLEKTFNKPVKAPQLSLVPVITLKRTFIMCAVEDFYPKDLEVRCEVNNTRMDGQIMADMRNNGTGLYTTQSLYEVSSETWNSNAEYACVVRHNGKESRVVKNLKAKFTFTLKPPIEREIFVHNKVVLEAVVSGDARQTVEDASVTCTVENERISSVTAGSVQFSKDGSQLMKIHNVTVDTKKWFDGKRVSCITHDTNEKRDIKKEIHFDKGSTETPSIFIYRPDIDDQVPSHVSLVCEVKSSKLGNVYIMWQINNKSYMEAPTTGLLRQTDSKESVLSILRVSAGDYRTSIIKCAVKHGNMKNTEVPSIASTSPIEPPEPETGFALNCNEDEEDEFKSLWSTATSFIFLFLFSLTYSALLSFSKMKQ